MTTSATPTPFDTLPFGPVLIGQTEKTLQALLRRALADTGLNEPEWVTLRLAMMLDGQVDHAGLVSAVTDRAKFGDTPQIVDMLIDRGLVADGRPTEVGREMAASVLAVSDRVNGSVWRDLPTDDVEAAARVLNEVLRRARELRDLDRPALRRRPIRTHEPPATTAVSSSGPTVARRSPAASRLSHRTSWSRSCLRTGWDAP